MSEYETIKDQQIEHTGGEIENLLGDVSDRLSEAVDDISDLADGVEELSDEIQLLLEDIRAVQGKTGEEKKEKLESLIDQYGIGTIIRTQGSYYYSSRTFISIVRLNTNCYATIFRTGNTADNFEPGSIVYIYSCIPVHYTRADIINIKSADSITAIIRIAFFIFASLRIFLLFR